MACMANARQKYFAPAASGTPYALGESLKLTPLVASPPHFHPQYRPISHETAFFTQNVRKNDKKMTFMLIF
jgi:hypothetical protein